MATAWTLDFTMPLVAAQAIQIRMALCSGMALRHQGGVRRMTRPQLSAWCLVVTEAKTISSETDCHSALGLDMALGSNPVR